MQFNIGDLVKPWPVYDDDQRFGIVIRIESVASWCKAYIIRWSDKSAVERWSPRELSLVSSGNKK